MNNNDQKRAVVLLSGGLDSTTVLAIANFQKYIVHALSFNYGQRHKQELSCAKQIAVVYKAVSHHIVDFDLREIGKSALTSDIPVPKNRLDKQQRTIPITYVPARNTIFLSFALALAETLNAQDIFIGANSIDYSGYPDCRPEYIKAYEEMANLATKVGVEGKQKLRIHSPLINLSKAEIIREGIALGVDYSLTHSCYDPDNNGLSCGECDSCLLRLKGFDEVGIEDPLIYAKRK